RVGGVVGRVGAADGDAADADVFGRADVLVREVCAGAAGAQAVARHAIVREGGDRGCSPVVNLVDPGGADYQRPGGDVGRRAGRGVDRVVGRVGAGHRDAADAHALGGARVFVGETGAAVAGAQTVARHAIIRKSHRRGGGAVINFVHARGADDQGFGGDVCRGAGCSVGCVIGRIGAGHRDAAHAHALGRGNVLVGKTGAAVAGAQTVAAHAIVGQGYRGAACPVVNFVHACGADGQRPRRDVRRRRGVGGSELIIASVAAVQAQARGRDGLARANRFAGEG